MKALTTGFLTAVLIFALAFLSVTSSLGQVKPENSAAPIPAERKFGLVEIFDNDAYPDSFKVLKLYTNVVLIREGMITKSQLPPDTATIYWPEDGVTQYIGTTTWRANTLFDTTYVEKERVDDPATSARWTITNMAKATNSPKLVFNKSFSYVQVTTTPSSATITCTCDRIEFFGERFEGHGNVKVWIDGAQVQTLSQGAPPWVTDFSRMIPSFGHTFPKEKFDSPATQHTLKLETDPGNQYIIDMVRFLNYTLTPRVRR